MNKHRLFAMFLALIVSISCLSLTASAEANPPSDDVIIWTSEPTEPQETRPAETQPPATERLPQHLLLLKRKWKPMPLFGI